MIGYLCEIPKGFEVDNHSTTEADRMIDTVFDLDEDKFRILTFNRNIH